jgi:hypothetical protein
LREKKELSKNNEKKRKRSNTKISWTNKSILVHFKKWVSLRYFWAFILQEKEDRVSGFILI